MDVILTNATLMAVAVWLIFLKLDIRRVVGYDVYVDILFTITLAWFMRGTYIGSMIAIIAGLELSILLYLTKKFIGYKRLVWHGMESQWRYFPPPRLAPDGYEPPSPL